VSLQEIQAETVMTIRPIEINCLQKISFIEKQKLSVTIMAYNVYENKKCIYLNRLRTVEI